MTKVTLIISDINKALAFEWIAEYLNKEKFNLDFILITQAGSDLKNELNKLNIPCKLISLPHRPTKRTLATVFTKLLWTLTINKPDIVHTHLRIATLLGIPAAFILRIKKRIHTRHHASYNHLYFPHAVKYDVFISKLSTHIISISDAVSKILIEKENVSIKKIIKIPHGFDFKLFEDIEENRIERIRNIYNIPSGKLTIGVIARYTEWKGIQFTIDAFGELLTISPEAHLVLANSTGPYSNQIRHLLSQFPDSSYTEITFETDLAALYRCFDLYIHVPINKHVEAFGQTYVEALASGIPSIFTLSGIANEFIIDRHNALVVDYQNAKQILTAIQTIITNDELRESLIKNGKQDIEIFKLNVFIHNLEFLYES